jgi:demethylmenaquinone methyltransferase/2-methoxy-6-polyprenyl-1,4-benzoquinol methylase
MDAHQRFFAGWSRFYESTPLLGPLLRRQQDAAIARLDPKPGERILDLSCGPGRGLRLLRERGARAVGLDASAPMLQRARPTGAPLVRGDACVLPFADGSFDGLLVTNAFHHYPDPPAALREMARVLAANGRAVLVDPRLDSLLSRLTIFGGEAMLFGMRVHLHDPREWVSLCTQAGFHRATAEPLATFPLPAISVLVVARK